MEVNNNTIFKALIKSPLIGALISLVFFFIYYFFSIALQANNEEFSSASYWFGSIWNFLKISPIILILFSIISYAISIPLGVILYKLKNKYLLSEHYFWLYTFFASSTVGLMFGLIDYYYESNLSKTILIIISFAFGGLFNASLFSVLTGNIPEKYKFANKVKTKNE